MQLGHVRRTKAMHRIKELLESASEADDRLSPGQLHTIATETLGSEPIVFVCSLLAMSIDSTSKIEIPPAEACRLGLMVMDRIYGPPDAKTLRKRSNADNQFELDFMWATPDGGEVHVTAQGEVT